MDKPKCVFNRRTGWATIQDRVRGVGAVASTAAALLALIRRVNYA